MSLVGKLIGFGLRQVIGTVAGDQAAGIAGQVIHLVEKHYTDNSISLPAALHRANERAWQAMSISLAGDGFIDQIKVFFASGDDRGIRGQVQHFLQDKTIGYDGEPTEFRQKCLDELQQARKSRLLSTQGLLPAKWLIKQTRFSVSLINQHLWKVHAGHRADC